MASKKKVMAMKNTIVIHIENGVYKDVSGIRKGQSAIVTEISMGEIVKETFLDETDNCQ